MSDVIKYIASFSDDAIHNAIEQTAGVEKEKFMNMLKTVQSVLEKPQEKLKKESRIVHISDKTIFDQKIRPQIAEKVDEYDRLETAGNQVEWKVRFDFIGDYKLLNIAALIKRYPRLMICGLSYAQITKHQKRLLDYLKTDTNLHDKLSQPLSVSAQNKAIEIQPVDIGVLKTVYSTDPDYVYEDYYYNPDSNATPEDDEQTRWLNESGEILDESLFDDDAELLEELENVRITE